MKSIRKVFAKLAKTDWLGIEQGPYKALFGIESCLGMLIGVHWIQTTFCLILEAMSKLSVGTGQSYVKCACKNNGKLVNAQKTRKKLKRYRLRTNN